MDDFTSKPNTSGFVPLGGSADGRIEVVSDGDWFRLDLQAGISYRIDIFGIGADALADPTAQLRTADRVTLASDNNSGDGTAARIIYTPASTSSYYVQVSESGRDATGDYRVSLSQNGDTPVDPAPPTGGADIVLNKDVVENGSFGNKFDGQTDADGVITASFQNTGGDAQLTLKGFDIDFANEVEVKLNGQSLGFLAKGANNGLNGGDSFLISASDQISGTNTITFEQNISDSYKWGVTDLLLQDAGSSPPVGPGDGILDVMMIGDSFSIPARGLPGKIEAALESRGYGDTEIIDLTQSGRNVFQARDAVLEHFDDPASTTPEIAILAIGINDALQGRDPADLERVLGRIVDELEGEGVEVLLAAPEPFYPLKSGDNGFSDPADQAAFRAVYEDLASEKGLVLASDFLDGLLDDKSLLQSDDFHPNQAGTDRILDNLLPEIEEVIDRALPSGNGALSASVAIEDIIHSDGGTS